MANVAFAQDKAHEATFQWVTGEPVNYKNWAPGEPNKKGLEYYGIFNYPTPNLWNDGPETESSGEGGYPGIYERNTPPPKDSKLKWIQWPKSDGGNNHWYAVNEIVDRWTTHMELAKSMNAHLATTTSEAENSFVARITSGFTWFGLHRSDAPIGRKKSPVNPPPGGYETTNLTGRLLGTPQSINRTSPTKSEPTQAQGNYTRQSLRIRTGLN